MDNIARFLSLEDWENKFNEIFLKQRAYDQLLTHLASFPADRIKDSVYDFWNYYVRALRYLKEQNDPFTAIDLLQKAEAIATKTPKVYLIRAQMALGLVYQDIGRWDEALKVAESALETIQRWQLSPIEVTEPTKKSELQYRQAGLWVNQALIYYALAEPEYCIKAAEKAIGLLENSAEIGYLVRAWSEKGLGLTLQKHYDAAQEAFNYALQLVEADDVEKSYVLQNLSDVFRLQGQWQEAHKYLQMALDQAPKEANDRFLGEVNMYLGVVAAHQADNARASARYHEAFAFLSKTHITHHLSELHLHWADLEEKQGDWLKALEHNQAAINLIHQLRDFIISPNERAKFISTQTQAYEDMINRLLRYQPQNVTDIFNLVETVKARVLTDLLNATGPGQSSQIDQSQPHVKKTITPEIIKLEAQHLETRLREEIYFLRSQPFSPELHSAIIALERQLTEMRERAVRQQSRNYTWASAKPLTLAEIQAQMAKDNLLIEYFPYREQAEDNDDLIAAFVIGNQEAEIQLLNIPIEAIKALFDSQSGLFDNLLTPGTASVNDTLRALGEYLLIPFGEKLRLAKTICFVPHSTLHYLPFHAMPLPSITDQVLANGEQRIIYAPSATLLFSYCQTQPDSPHKNALAVGCNQPNYPISHLSGQLNHAEAEAISVSKIVAGNSVPLIGPAANRDSLFRLASGYRYIHLSCHGHFNATQPEQSCIYLFDARPDVYDIYHHLKLNAELVCLSACQTGLNYVMRGDEVIGLVRAFLYAGSRSV
nr:CHAT domain-containing protein [Anaerolineae bacterium]